MGADLILGLAVIDVAARARGPAGRAPVARRVVALRPCLTCRRLTRSGSYCPAHTPSHVSPGRGSGSRAAAFRRATLAKTEGRCARCGSTDRVEAHHVIALADGGANDAETNGEALCFEHHRGPGRERGVSKGRANAGRRLAESSANGGGEPMISGGGREGMVPHGAGRLFALAGVFRRGS